MGSRSKSNQTRREQRQGNREVVDLAWSHNLIWPPSPDLKTWYPPHTTGNATTGNANVVFVELHIFKETFMQCILVHPDLHITHPILGWKIRPGLKTWNAAALPILFQGLYSWDFPSKEVFGVGTIMLKVIGYLRSAPKKNTPHVLCHNCFHNKCRIDQKSWCSNNTCIKDM